MRPASRAASPTAWGGSRRRNDRLFALAWLLAVLAGCSAGSSMRIDAAQNPSVDLAAYRTFAWSAPSVRRESFPSVSMMEAGRASGVSDNRQAFDWRIQRAVDA